MRATAGRRLALTCLVSIVVLAAAGAAAQDDTEQIFARGVTWARFLDATRAQRDLWLKTTAGVTLTAEAVERFRRAARELRLLVVAEDWCPDSARVVPYVAGLAEATSVPLQIVDRTVGAPIMSRHRTPDGRVATPTIVLLRGSAEVAAWVERPGIVQQWFLSMATSAESARRFGERQAWYDADHGQTVLDEVTRLAEQTTAGK